MLLKTILSTKYSIEIAVDIQNARFNRFGEDKSYSKRIFVIYDGIHYGPLQIEVFDAKFETVFSTNDDLCSYSGSNGLEKPRKDSLLTSKLYSQVYDLQD